VKYFVVKNESGSYYTEMRVIETKAVHFKGELIGHEDTYRPKFEGRIPEHASKYGTEADCNDLMTNPAFGGPDTWAGCTIEKVET
jgi:hypothetical protein